MIQKFNRGDVYYYNFGAMNDGSIEGKLRPCVIVSNDAGNKFSTTAVVLPITTRDKTKCREWQVYFENEGRGQIILCEQARTINVNRLEKYVGKLDEITMQKVDIALSKEFNLNVSVNELTMLQFMEKLNNKLDKILSSKLNKFDSKILNIIDNIDSKNEEFNDLFSNINKVLTELNKLSSNISKNVYSSDKNKDDDIYDENYAKNFISDYYSPKYRKDIKSFMNKYSIKSKVDINNLIRTMRKILTQHGIDYHTLKNNSYLKSNNKKSNNKKINNKNRQPRINYKDVAFNRAFLIECENHDSDFICRKYNLTKKQLANRKYSLRKYFKNNNIEV